MKYLYGVRCSYQGCGNTLPAKGWLKIGDYCYCDERCAARDSKLRNKEEVLDVTFYYKLRTAHNEGHL